MADGLADTYRRNLSALHAVAAESAELIDNAVVSPDIVPAIGRDGRPQFLLRSAEGRRVWFGGSSMPSVSAVELFGTFTSDGRNVALPGIMTGTEAVILLAAMPPHAALFILEPEAVHLKLAMHLHDVSRPIEQERWIPLVGALEVVEDRLVSFFERHPGFEFPARLLTPPQCSSHEVAAWQRVLERAGARAMELQQRRVSHLVLSVRAQVPESLPERPSVAVLCTDARPAAIEQCHRMARALTRLRWRYEICMPDSPGACHAVARWQAVETAQPEWVLWAGNGAGSMRARLPDRLPVASWLGADAEVTAELVKSMQSSDRLLVTTDLQFRAALSAGVSADALELVAPAADDGLVRSPADHADENEMEFDAVVLADLPDDRPAAVGVAMLSHVRLWEAARRIARAAFRGDRPPSVRELLEQAQSVTNVALEDAELRRRFTELLQVNLLPAAFARAVVDTLIDAKLSPAVRGRNWELPGGPSAGKSGELPRGDALKRLLRRAKVVVLPFAGPFDVQRALDALCAGTIVCMRQADPPWEMTYSSLKSIAHSVFHFTSPRELASITGRALAEWENRARVHAAQEAIEREHTVSSRVRAIWTSLSAVRGVTCVS